MFIIIGLGDITACLICTQGETTVSTVEYTSNVNNAIIIFSFCRAWLIYLWEIVHKHHKNSYQQISITHFPSHDTCSLLWALESHSPLWFILDKTILKQGFSLPVLCKWLFSLSISLSSLSFFKKTEHVTIMILLGAHLASQCGLMCNRDILWWLPTNSK